MRKHFTAARSLFAMLNDAWMYLNKQFL